MCAVVLQVVNDITTFYMQMYKDYETTGDEHLKETLRVIQTGVGHFCSKSNSFSLKTEELLAVRRRL